MNSPQLQSLSISPSSVTAQNGQAQFMATGQFSNSMRMAMSSMSPVSVSWFQSMPAFDPPGQMIPFMLTSQPFTARCVAPGTTVTVVAFAPMSGNMGASGSMPLQVFMDLAVNHTTSQEDGFVAATAQMICP